MLIVSLIVAVFQLVVVCLCFAIPRDTAGKAASCLVAGLLFAMLTPCLGSVAVLAQAGLLVAAGIVASVARVPFTRFIPLAAACSIPPNEAFGVRDSRLPSHSAPVGLSLRPPHDPGSSGD